MTCPSPDFQPHSKGHPTVALEIKEAFRISNLGMIPGHVNDFFELSDALHQLH
jgi:hypothetical protein